MLELLRLFTQIALLRRGPQDIPASPVLLGLTVLGYFAVNALVSLVLPPIPGAWLPQLGVEMLFMLAWYALLLRVAKRPERFLQTATAMFGYQLVLSPLLIASSWLIQRFPQDSVWLFPVLIIALVLAVWLIAAGGHVLKAALELTLAASVGLFILQIVAGQLALFVLFTPPTS